jgi:hypothetical protein
MSGLVSAQLESIITPKYVQDYICVDEVELLKLISEAVELPDVRSKLIIESTFNNIIDLNSNFIRSISMSLTYLKFSYLGKRLKIL